MSATVTIASNPADARAVDTVRDHHAELLGALSMHVAGVVNAATARDERASIAARDELTRWCTGELVPHAVAEEATLYSAAATLPSAALLIAATTDEHATIQRLVADLTAATDPVEVAATAVALRVVVERHMATENARIVPLLAGAPDVSLAELLDHMHTSTRPAKPDGVDDDVTHVRDDDSCGCDEDVNGLPELDARVVPHAIRHATIFGALDAVRPGGGMVLVAPHDPVPLLEQIAERDPGAFQIDYLERGPETWRLQFLRTG